MPTLNELAKEISLLDYLQQQGYEPRAVGHDQDGGQIYHVNPCPICGSKDHFTIYESQNTYSSFSGCCKGGTIIDYLQEAEGNTFADAARFVRERSEDFSFYPSNPQAARSTAKAALYFQSDGESKKRTPVQGGSLKPVQVKEYAEIINKCEDLTPLVHVLYHDTQASEKQYFINRGITAGVIDKYKLSVGHVREQDGTRKRAVFPVWYRGRAIYYTARIMADNWKPKYYNAPLPESAARPLFNGHLLVEGSGAVIITEGPVDALVIESVTGREAAALMSTTGTKGALDLMEQHPGGVFFLSVMDNDEAGRRATQQLAEAGALAVPMPEEYKDPAEWGKADPEGMRRAIDDTINHERLRGSIFEYIREGFNQEVKLNREAPSISTGFALLDAEINGGLYPGLHVLGGPTGLGKTAIALQMADRAAAQRVPVLYVSLEMGRYELVCRSLARIGHEKGPASYTFAELINGSAADSHIDELTRRYLDEVGRDLFMMEGNFGLTVEKIRKRVEEIKTQVGRYPLVIVDYLQAIEHEDPRLSDKQKIDHAVLSLKRMSRDLFCPVLVLSSFNREATKRSKGALESFKESGGIEYTADTVIAMGKPEQDEIMLLADEAPGRRLVILEVLKNRRGQTGRRIKLNYHPAQNHFQEPEAEAQPKQNAAIL